LTKDFKLGLSSSSFMVNKHDIKMLLSNSAPRPMPTCYTSLSTEQAAAWYPHRHNSNMTKSHYLQTKDYEMAFQSVCRYNSAIPTSSALITEPSPF